MLDDLLAKVASIALQDLFGSGQVQNSFAGGGSLGTGLGNLLGPIFSGFRQSGGSVGAGRAVVVGEKGPEIFQPGRSGTVVPTGALGGTDVVVNNFTGARTETRKSRQPNGRELVEILVGEPEFFEILDMRDRFNPARPTVR